MCICLIVSNCLDSLANYSKKIELLSMKKGLEQMQFLFHLLFEWLKK